MPKRKPAKAEAEELVEHEETQSEGADDGGHEPDPDEGDDDQLEADAGEDDLDSGEDDASREDEGGAPEDEHREVAGGPRGKRQFGELRRENRELRDQVAEVSRRLETAERGGGQVRQDPQRVQRERDLALEAARLEGPEAASALRERWIREDYDNKFAGLSSYVADTTDRQAFDALCARQPAIERIRADVERERRAIMAQGFPPMPRESVAYYLLGKKAVERAPGAKARQVSRAQARVARQAAKPGRAGGDVRGGQERSGSDQQKRRARLENQQI